MSAKKPSKQSKKTTPDFSAMPDFARAIKGLANVPKQEVDDAIEKEKASKKAKQLLMENSL